MINRVFDEDAVVICASTDDNYVPYLLVLLKSIIENAAVDKNYDIIIFEFAMLQKNKQIIEEQCWGYENISIRVININSELEFDENLLVTRTLTKEIWLKSLAIYAMSEYKKAIILDCDVICIQDLAELYETELEDNLIGAVKFLNCYIYKNNKFLNSRQINLLEHDIDIREDYFNYGVVLQNLEAFRNTYSLSFFLEKVFSQNYLVQDQDLMNVLCKGRVKWIDSKWNTYPFLPDEFHQSISMVEDIEREYWIKGYKEPACIHFTTPVKPWLETRGVYSYAGSFFWDYASRLENFDFSFFINQIKEYNADKEFLNHIVGKNYESLYKEVQEKALYVYGYGARGRQIIQEQRFEIRGIIDLDKSKHDLNAKVPIGGLELIENVKDVVILIANDKWEKIALMLKRYGKIRIYSYVCLEKLDRISWGIEENDWYLVSQCFKLFADEKSNKIFELIISKRNRYLQDRTVKYLDIQEGNQYFRNDFFYITDKEVYVDIGMNIKYTIQGFVDFTNGKYQKIYGFEMGNYENAFATNEKIVFKNSKVVDEKMILELIGERVTFIKINSGNVKEILHSMKKIIMQCAPKLVINIANRYADLWEIPCLLNSYAMGYKFFLRHHMSDSNDTVLYVTK